MRGRIVAEKQFLHQAIDHHVFVTAIENADNEYRFEVRRIAPGDDHAETVYEKVVNFSVALSKDSDTTIEQLISTELDRIKHEVSAEEDIHAHDP